MGTEIEIKLRLSDAAELRERLAACGARLAGRVLETNAILDTPDNALRAADSALRVRRVGPLRSAERPHESGDSVTPESTWLTFKGPRSGRGLRRREELETQVQGVDALMAILARLGLTERVIYEKRREIWRLEGCEVALDELPGLGSFVEIEGPDEQTVLNIRTQLGLERAEGVDATYVELTDRLGRQRPDGVRELRF